MKKFLLLFLLATAPLFAQNTKFNHLGKWEAIDKGEAIFVIFDAEGYVTLKKGDEVIGGKSFEMEGIKASMKYVFDPEGAQGHLDMVMALLDSDESHTLFCLYKVVGPDEIIIAMGGPERPADFEGASALTFKRIN